MDRVEKVTDGHAGTPGQLVHQAHGSIKRTAAAQGVDRADASDEEPEGSSSVYGNDGHFRLCAVRIASENARNELLRNSPRPPGEAGRDD